MNYLNIVNKNQTKKFKMQNPIRLIKEYFRILKLKNTPISPFYIANCWLRLQITPGKKEQPFLSNIGNIKLFASTHYDFNELLDEIFLVNSYYVPSINEAQPIILDCGGNCGFATIYFKLMYPEAKITTFEPNPYVYEILKKNIKLNNFTDIIPVNAACGGKNEVVDFTIDEQYSLASSYLNQIHSKTIKVQKIALSDFINKEISLIKMDIEGAEFEVIQNLIETNKIKNVKRFAIEFHNRLFRNNSNLGEFLKLLEISGFDYNLFAYRKQQEFYSNKWQSIMIYAFKQ